MEAGTKRSSEEIAAEAARKKKLKIVRHQRKQNRLKHLKSLGMKPNRRLTKNKRSGKSLKDFFIPGSDRAAEAA